MMASADLSGQARTIGPSRWRLMAEVVDLERAGEFEVRGQVAEVCPWGLTETALD